MHLEVTRFEFIDFAFDFQSEAHLIRWIILGIWLFPVVHADCNGDLRRAFARVSWGCWEQEARAVESLTPLNL